MTRGRIFDAFRRSRTKERDVDWVPLADAARALSEARRDTDLDRMARGLGESEDVVLAFWAQHVARGGIRLHGRRMLSHNREEIPVALIHAGRIRDGATRLEVGGGEAINDFGALEVRRTDLEDLLATVDKGEAPSG